MELEIKSITYSTMTTRGFRFNLYGSSCCFLLTIKRIDDCHAPADFKYFHDFPTLGMPLLLSSIRFMRMQKETRTSQQQPHDQDNICDAYQTGQHVHTDELNTT